jgi:hypothetical protein
MQTTLLPYTPLARFRFWPLEQDFTMKLTLWAVLAFLGLGLALQDQHEYAHADADDLEGINVTRRW